MRMLSSATCKPFRLKFKVDKNDSAHYVCCVAAAQYNLKIDKGGAFDFSLRILDALDEPVTLSGGSTAFKAQIREDHRKPLIASFTVGPYPVEAPDGTVRFLLTAAQTLLLDPNKKYVWDFFWTDTAGIRRRILFGKVSVEENITHLS